MEILENHRAGKETILFIDEINRSDYLVQQELMQLIQDRQINNVKLPDSCHIITAGNPENSGNYQVNIMNDALKDRFIWFEMESNVSEWLMWASKNEVLDDIVEFIADHGEMLHVVNELDEIKPTPRSWDKFNQIIKVMLKDQNRSIEEAVLNPETDGSFLTSVGKGVIGLEAVSSFISFLSAKDNPLLTFDDIFIRDKYTDEELENIIKDETNPRIAIMNQRIIKNLEKVYKNKPEVFKTYIDKYILLLNSYGSDIRVASMVDMAKNHEHLHKEFMKKTDYMNTFIDVIKKVNY